MLKRHAIHEGEGSNQSPPAHAEDSKPHSSHSHDESNWLISYADMMTLLCGFFIMLFSMATLDIPKYEKFKEAIAKQFGGKYVQPNQDLAKTVSDVIQESQLAHQASVKLDTSGVSINFQSTVFFGTLSAELSKEGRAILEKLIQSIEQRQKDSNKYYRIIVEGHTDSRPISGGTYASNWELSGARASRVVRIFLTHQFSPRQLTAIAYADTHPIVAPKTSKGAWDESALGKNRRVVLRILESSVNSIPFPDDTSTNPSPASKPPSQAPIAALGNISPVKSAH